MGHCWKGENPSEKRARNSTLGMVASVFGSSDCLKPDWRHRCQLFQRRGSVVGDTPASMKSVRRPGAATTMSQPRITFRACRRRSAPPSCPPYAMPTLMPAASWNFSSSRAIWSTSSRVGGRSGPRISWEFRCVAWMAVPSPPPPEL